MRFLGSLLRDVALMIVLAAGLAWTVAVMVFPLDAAQLARLRVAFLVAIPLEIAVVSGALAALTAPLRRVLDRGEGVADRLVAVAARTGHRLAAYVAMIVLLCGGAAVAAVVATMRAGGLPMDLAAAGAGVGVASAILAAMLAYSRAAAHVARIFERLGARVDAGVRGTVRGKILVLGFGLNTIGLLLFAATGYVRYRTDMDRAYVEVAQRAQKTAMRASHDHAEPQIAEHVWLVTGADAALLGPGGGTIARFGDQVVAFDRARAAPGEVLALPGGWLVSEATLSGGLVVSWLPEERLEARRAEFWRVLTRTVLLVYAATALLAWLAARAITLPFRTLGRAADRIASGDLTASPPSVSRDEMGQLATDFRRMAQGLKSLVVDVQSASEGVSVGARETTAIGERVRRGAIEQHGGVVAVQAAVEAMEGSVAQVARGVGGLSDYVAATTQAVGEMAAAYEEVRRKGAELERAMESTLVDVEHLGSAGREAEATLGRLEAVANDAGHTLGTVRSSVATLETAAGESEATAALVHEMAERAGGVVEETVHGIETLRAAVSDAHHRIASLGRRSDDIHQVVDFISEVAGRTNLLSLNASIIAAQAGEHGKAFAVVAEQIRELAAQIARSTKSIGDIIHAVREDVEGTAALIDRGDALAVEGVQLARNSLEALSRIQRSTVQGRETAAAIRAAVSAHALSSREVSRLVESISDGSRAVTAAVQLVGRSVAGVHAVARSVSAMADQVARALDEQSGLGRRQLDSLSRLERMIHEISRAVESHDAATRRVRDALAALSRAADEHEGAVDGLAGVSDRLGARARALAEQVGRFKV